MSYRKKKSSYGENASWRQWRDANTAALTEAGVPSVALESERNWRFFVQEANAELLGGYSFRISDLTTAQQRSLYSLLQGLPDATVGMQLFVDLERLCNKQRPDERIRDRWPSNPRRTMFDGGVETISSVTERAMYDWRVDLELR